MVEFGNFAFHFLQKFNRHSLDFPNILLREVLREQHIIKRQLLVAGETLTDIPSFFLIHVFYNLHQFIKGFLNRCAILLAVIVLNDLLIAFMIYDAIGIIQQHGIQSATDQFCEVFHYQILFLCLGKLAAQ